MTSKHGKLDPEERVLSEVMYDDKDGKDPFLNLEEEIDEGWYPLKSD